MTALSLLFVALTTSQASRRVELSAGFTSNMVLQRSSKNGPFIYGFASDIDGEIPGIFAEVEGVGGGGEKVKYTKKALYVRKFEQDETPSDPATPQPPPHGSYEWKVELNPSNAGGNYSILIHDDKAGDMGEVRVENVTYGDVWFCSGQSNMALSLSYTFSVESLARELRQANDNITDIRHFQYGGMGDHFEAYSPQWITTWNSLSADPNLFHWHIAKESAKEPLHLNKRFSPFALFSATCMYFGVELSKRMATKVPIGLIQSAVGGTQIESWMSNETLSTCSDVSRTGGAVPQNNGRLYYGMVAPFANYSVRGMIWYQGENNVYGDPGNSIQHQGYGCELPAMIRNWRNIWRSEKQPLFGVAALAGGGSEGYGYHMGEFRWAETANFGHWNNPQMPNTFGAQVYDLEDPWAVVLGRDPYNCSLPDPNTGKYGKECKPFPKPDKWSKELRYLAPLVRNNSPAGIPGSAYMGGIHPRDKRPVGERLALSAIQLLHPETQSSLHGLAGTGPTLVGCKYHGHRLVIGLNVSLLGKEGLELRPFNNNRSSWGKKVTDSLGGMVCIASSTNTTQRIGNQTTCHCQGWDYIMMDPPKGSQNPGTFWYCRFGPGYKPPKHVIQNEDRRKQVEKSIVDAKLRYNTDSPLTWVPATNPYQSQWIPVDLKSVGSNRYAVEWDLKQAGIQDTVHAIRLAWPLFDSPYLVGDTCCPSKDVREGKAICLPGSCPLYTNITGLTYSRTLLTAKILSLGIWVSSRTLLTSENLSLGVWVS
ncbi:hypothetical protein AAMO2058_000538400 [Amorphochlora amoebiformis]